MNRLVKTLGCMLAISVILTFTIYAEGANKPWESTGAV